MAEKRYFLLRETIPSTEIKHMMCRVVTSKTFPLSKFAPFPPASPSESPHNTDDIIPSILPNPSLSSNRKEFLSAVREKKINLALTTFFGFDVARTIEESTALESELVKQFTLHNPERHFQTLLDNEEYAKDVRSVLESSPFGRAYLITGFLTTTGTCWKIEQGGSKTNELTVSPPISELVGVYIPDVLSFSLSPACNTVTRQKREMFVQEEEIFAVSYSAVRQSYSFNRSLSRPVTKTPVVGPPKRAKARHLALSPDSDEEIEASSDDDDSESPRSLHFKAGANTFVMDLEENYVLPEDDELSFHIE